jgi:hypothetical protein
VSQPQDLILRWAPIPKTAQEAFFDDDTPDGYLLFTGGWGSGKTMTLTAKMLKLSAINAPRLGLWCVPDYGHIHDTILPTLTSTDASAGEPEPAWFLSPGQFHYHETRHVLSWIGGGDIQFVTGENPQSIAGPNAAFCGTDEPGSIKREAWRNTVARVRDIGAKLRQKVAAGTPEGLNYLNDLFGPDRRPGYHRYTMRTVENSYLPESYLEQVRANSSEAELAAYLDGQFVNMVGALAYNSFNADVQMRAFSLDPDLPLRLAFDFNVDPMALVVGQQISGPAGPEFLVYESIALMGSTVYDICAKFREKYPFWKKGLIVYGDATGRRRSHLSLKSNYDAIREELTSVGPLTEKVPTENPAVTTRLNSVNRLCKDGRGFARLWLNGDAQKPRSSPCLALVKSLQQTVKKSGTDDLWKKSGETITHLSDALGYWLTYEAPATKPTSVVATIKPTHTPGMSNMLATIKAAKTARLRAELEAGRV